MTNGLQQGTPVAWRLKTLVSIAALFFVLASGANSQTVQQPLTAVQPCQYRLTDSNASAVLSIACKNSLERVTHLPDYLCDERIVRQTTDHEKSDHSDIILAQVRFSEGHETYSVTQINGRPPDRAFSWVSGFSSFGEFASVLRALFDPGNETEFTFRKDTKFDSRPALLYEFTVRRANNKSLWHVNTSGYRLYPGYKGRLWLDPASAQPMRIEMRAQELPAGFPFPSLSLFVEFAETSLGDGSKFVLPVQSQSLACDIKDRNCLRNKITFTRCRKFGAEHQIVPE